MAHTVRNIVWLGLHCCHSLCAVFRWHVGVKGCLVAHRSLGKVCVCVCVCKGNTLCVYARVTVLLNVVGMVIPYGVDLSGVAMALIPPWACYVNLNCQCSQDLSMSWCALCEHFIAVCYLGYS